MIYNWCNPNPFVLVIVICPLISLLMGAFLALFRCRKWLAPALAFLLPLLYITSDLATFQANVDAWLMWGIMYAFLAHGMGWLMWKFR